MSKIDPKKKTKIPKTEEKALPSAEKKKRNWQGRLSTILLIIGLSVIWFYFAAMITNHDGVYGPWGLLSHKLQGQYAILFTAMIISIFLIGIKMGIISWKPARKMVIFAAVLIAAHVLALSIWQERWQPRKWARSIGRESPKPAEASGGPAKTWKTVPGSKKAIIGKVANGTFVPKPVAKYGDEIKIGHRMVLTAERKDQDFYVSIGGKWAKKTGSWSFVNQYPGKGEILQALAGEGVKLNWELQEFS